MIDDEQITELVKKILDVGQKRSSGSILIFDELTLTNLIREFVENLRK